jgi:hypothetical protein
MQDRIIHVSKSSENRLEPEIEAFFMKLLTIIESIKLNHKEVDNA